MSLWDSQLVNTLFQGFQFVNMSYFELTLFIALFATFCTSRESVMRRNCWIRLFNIVKESFGCPSGSARMSSRPNSILFFPLPFLVYFYPCHSWTLFFQCSSLKWCTCTHFLVFEYFSSHCLNLISIDIYESNELCYDTYILVIKLNWGQWRKYIKCSTCTYKT